VYFANYRCGLFLCHRYISDFIDKTSNIAICVRRGYRLRGNRSGVAIRDRSSRVWSQFTDCGLRSAACGCWSLLIDRTQKCACTELVVLHCPYDYRYLCFVESIRRTCCIDMYRNSAKITHRMSCCNGYRPDSYPTADFEFPLGYFRDSWQPIPVHVETLCR